MNSIGETSRVAYREFLHGVLGAMLAADVCANAAATTSFLNGLATPGTIGDIFGTTVTNGRGFEGLAISPDGKFSYAMPQSAMLDEGAGKGVTNRIVKFDILTNCLTVPASGGACTTPFAGILDGFAPIPGVLHACKSDALGFTAAVPEPESRAMLLAGLGLMGYIARRRKAERERQPPSTRSAD